MTATKPTIAEQIKKLEERYSGRHYSYSFALQWRLQRAETLKVEMQEILEEISTLKLKQKGIE